MIFNLLIMMDDFCKYLSEHGPLIGWTFYTHIVNEFEVVIISMSQVNSIIYPYTNGSIR